MDEPLSPVRVYIADFLGVVRTDLEVEYNLPKDKPQRPRFQAALCKNLPNTCGLINI